MPDPREHLIELTRAQLRLKGYADREISTLNVPGRIEMFGKHTDYCGGRSLLVATEQRLCFSVAARSDSRIHVQSINQNVECSFDLSAELTPTVGHWSNYPMTVARRVARNFPEARNGCEIAIASDLPPAAGLSSSSAMIIGTFLSVARVNNLSHTDGYGSNITSQEDLSAYLGSIENGSSFRSLAGDRGVGTTGGSQDHTAILCCKRGAVSQFAFCPVRHERSIPLSDELVFVIGVSGVVAEKTGAALQRYNAVAKSARTIVRLFNERYQSAATCLAQVWAAMGEDPTAAAQLVSDSPPLIARLHQFSQESFHIIPSAAKALVNGEWSVLGDLADQSQQLAERCLDNQIPETIRLQRSARSCGAIASSAFGAGFGGSVWALVHTSDAEEFTRRWSRCGGTMYSTRASNPAGWLS